MKTSTRCLLSALAVLTIVLFACGDDESPTQPAALTPPAENLNGTYELLDFREWGFIVSGGGTWGDPGVRTDFNRSPASYETHSGHMAFADTFLFQLFVQDGDSVRMPVSIRSITYTDETDQGVMDAQYGFSLRSITFDSNDMDLRFDYATAPVSIVGAQGETTRWEIWKKISNDVVSPW